MADAKAAGVEEDEMRRIIDHLARRPDAGDLIPGTGGARKVRFAGASEPVFLLTVFGKGDKVDLSQAERNQLRKELAGLVDDYRNGVRRHVRRR